MKEMIYPSAAQLEQLKNQTVKRVGAISNQPKLFDRVMMAKELSASLSTFCSQLHGDASWGVPTRVGIFKSLY
jgi:hypothetical protein